jgi:hypothetical protein
MRVERTVTEKPPRGVSVVNHYYYYYNPPLNTYNEIKLINNSVKRKMLKGNIKTTNK